MYGLNTMTEILDVLSNKKYYSSLTISFVSCERPVSVENGLHLAEKFPGI
jgi:hypothetical protein